MKQELLNQIFKELHREAYLWSRQCCGFDDELAKDVLQQVYLKIWEEKAKYNSESKIKTWLFSVIRFTALEWLRKNQKVVPLHADFDLVEEERIPETASHEDLIQLLPERQKEVLLLVFYHQMTLEKAAEVMEVSIGTARTHYDRGKKKLKELILIKQTYEATR
ncbi:RNA polymerase sigma factor, sigma-70 family [Belliella baltica DSM 15883]|uniref:RNA polymerase sigma factor, sigma-70 family n=1 Tax=Belliella baltica (strain DSM 15883 / CIP 108006 / LMG 21964 / BA134) TaxID=866536 RepID=I3Z2B7_BELBD|nr:RNA polymerase sigma factor [Belliella baltica]AFL83385.1 RNA polymerase sigma factor, sigma-70 family [Belliella baltica DSM 15883]